MAQPLIELVSGDGGLLGQMPLSLATRMKKVLEHHKLETNLIEGKQESPPVKVLLLDESYVVAMDFTVGAVGAEAVIKFQTSHFLIIRYCFLIYTQYYIYSAPTMSKGNNDVDYG